MNWSLWVRQALTIMKMELSRYVLGRRWIGVYIAAYAPVALLLFVAVNMQSNIRVADLSEAYALLYQTFILRLSIFFSCALVFSQLFRGEILEKTLHFYLLAPARREVIAAGKYLAGVVTMAAIFATSTILTNLLMYVPAPASANFFSEGDGIPYLARYVLVTVLACVAYGGIFTLTGLYFRNPIIPAIVVGLWEAFYFILPETLQKLTVMHYLQSMLPLVIDRGPFSVVIGATSGIIGVPILLAISVGLVWLSGRMLCRTEITYSAD